jgi:hypothetical protein
MNNSINEYEFKSLRNSTGEDKLDWCIIKMAIRKAPGNIPGMAGIYCFYRKILYLDQEKKPYQVGTVYLPLGWENFLLAAGMFLKRKSFGHFLSGCFNEVSFELLETRSYYAPEHPLLGKYNIQFSGRIISILKGKKRYYVEEELAVD